MLGNFGWVVKDRLAGMARPRPGQGKEIRAEGIGSVLVLTEEPPQPDLAHAGLEVLHVPIADFSAPDTTILRRCVDFIDGELERGRAVAVHCQAGVGRTGTVLAAYLAAKGRPPREAIDAVRRARPGSLETRGQEEAVEAFAAAAAAPPRRRVALAGAMGRMGRVIGPGIEAAPDFELVARIGPEDDLVETCRRVRAELVVDFTTPTAAVANAGKILDAGCQGVVGTTGFTDEDLEALEERAHATGHGLLVAPNFALGSLLLQRFAAEAARHLPSVEIVEYHHDAKRDAPSGTALRTAAVVARARGDAPPGPPADPGETSPARGYVWRGVPVHSVRLPGLLAHQEVLFGGPGELLTLRHDALSRECYLPGVLLALRAMADGRVGLWRGLEEILFP